MGKNTKRVIEVTGARGAFTHLVQRPGEVLEEGFGVGDGFTELPLGLLGLLEPLLVAVLGLQARREAVV